MKNDKTSLYFGANMELKEKLYAEAKKQQRPVNNMIMLILRKYFNNKEKVK